MTLRSRVLKIAVIIVVGCLCLAVLVGNTIAPFGVTSGDAASLNFLAEASAGNGDSAYSQLDTGAEAGSRRLATNSSADEQAYPDVQMPQACTPGTACSSGMMPQERGLCVKSGLTEECWDVCNIDHSPQSYQIAPMSPMNSALAGMVASVREGLNSYVECPASLAQGDVCVPGKICSERMSKDAKIPIGQGMCVVDASKPSSRACWDMCDFAHEVAEYTVGTPAGAGDKVDAMRNSHVCPSSNWWLPWLLAVIAVIVLLCCVAVVLAVVFGRKKSRGSSAARLDAQPEFNHDFLSPPPDEQMPENYDQQPQDYGQDPQGYQQEYGSDSRDMRMPEPPGQQYAQDGMQQDMLPPEPPRMEPTQMQPWQDPHAQMPDRRISHDLLGPISPSQSHNQQPSQFDYQMAQMNQVSQYSSGMSASRQNSGFPAAGSMRVPGLNEPPPLFQSIQPLVVPHTTAQMAPAELLSQAVPMQQPNPFINYGDPLGMSQSHGTFPNAMQAPTSFNAFQTQVPTTFTTQPPMSVPSSLHFQPGVAAAQPFFTQLARR